MLDKGTLEVVDIIYLGGGIVTMPQLAPRNASSSGSGASNWKQAHVWDEVSVLFLLVGICNYPPATTVQVGARGGGGGPAALVQVGAWRGGGAAALVQVGARWGVGGPVALVQVGARRGGGGPVALGR